jgi:hypothetical protein
MTAGTFCAGLPGQSESQDKIDFRDRKTSYLLIVTAI